jgi:hypothetical protein
VVETSTVGGSIWLACPTLAPVAQALTECGWGGAAVGGGREGFHD